LEDGRVIKMNNAYSQSTGYNEEFAKDKTSIELGFWTYPAERDLFKQMIKDNKSVRDMEFHFSTSTGEHRLGLISGEGIDINGEPCIISVLMDITELRKMEFEMDRLDRLNLVGEMAASIGHEIRNPLTTIRGFIQFIWENENYQQEKDYSDLMIEEIDRANSIITEFLSLARDKMVELEPTDLNSIIIKLLPLIQPKALSHDQNIKLEFSDLPDLLLDKKEIRQLILNLVNNGLEAMSSPGNVTIRTFIEDEQVVLAVQDQGHGIENELMDKLGTPFLTTKEQGTGLGLAVCYKIAARHNARIDIDTGSAGTTFYVRFSKL
ncbi:MAG: ATP-binding protein, partial [Chitinophagales bacterium]